MTGKEALEKVKKQYDRQNGYNKEKYDRLGTTFEKGTKERILASGSTIGSFIRSAVLEKLERERL